MNPVWGKFCPSSRLLALLFAATCAVACGLNPQPEPPLAQPNMGPVASGGSAGSVAEGGGGGSEIDHATAGMENNPVGPGVAGGGTGNNLGAGGGSPTAAPDDVRDADAAAGFVGDSGVADGGGSVVFSE